MIDELLNRDAGGQFREPAKMIAMPVSNDQVIDLRNAGVFQSGDDAFSITNGARSHVPSVDEDRLTRGGHKKHRITALDINNIDVQRRSHRPCLGKRRRYGNSEGQQLNCDLFAHKSTPWGFSRNFRTSLLFNAWYLSPAFDTTYEPTQRALAKSRVPMVHSRRLTSPISLAKSG